MTETVGLRERIARALFDAFRDGFEEAYGERPEGWGETSEATRVLWRDHADALLPTEGEPVGLGVMIHGYDESKTPSIGRERDQWKVDDFFYPFQRERAEEAVEAYRDECKAHVVELYTTPQESAERLNLPGHKCEPIADFGRYMNDMGQERAGEREWWIGRLTEPIEGFPEEKWCFHIRTPLKPEIVFGFNEADLNYLVATIYAALGYHTNPDWVEKIATSARAALNPETDG